jgi:hypothetical protein
MFEPELNVCTGLRLAGNCLFLNPKKENDSETSTHFLDSKISKNPMNEFYRTINIKTNIYAYIQLKRLDKRI